MIKNPNPLAHNAVDPRVRVRTGHRIQHHRLDPSQSQFAGQHQPIRAGSRDDDLRHLAGFRVVRRRLVELIDLVGGYRRDAEFGGDGVDRLLCDVEVGLAIGGEIRGDVALVVLLRFITRQSIEERGEIVAGQGRLFGDRPEGPLVGPHQRLQRGAVQRDVGGVHGDAHGGDLEVIADPREQMEPFFLGDPDHNVRETLDLVSRAYIIHDGMVLTHGTAQEIVNNEDVRRVYLGDQFRI